MDGKIISIGKGFGPGMFDKDGNTKVPPQPRREVRAYWEALRHEGAVPLREAIDPRGIAGALEHVFMIERIATGLARFRLVGSRISELVGCEVRGMPFTALFDPVGRGKIGPMLESLFCGPAIYHIDLEAERGIGRPALGAHLLLLPLVSQAGKVDLALGCLTLDGPIGRAPRRFAVARMNQEKLVTGAPTPEPAAETRAFAEPPADFALPAPPRSERHLRLVHSAD